MVKTVKVVKMVKMIKVVKMVKKPSARAGHSGDVGSIPKSGRCPREGIVTHSSIPTSKIPWTEDFGRL